ncbi:MAG TPA: NUDIX domain-containing protein [Acidimicrobiales bacterium]|nr:NUDIX domain-containing protein [Acidimicrobiales bacterium]
MIEPSSPEPDPDFSGVIECVVALVRDAEDRVLLASASEEGPWSFLGGPVNAEESLERAAIRIPFDDCGVSVELGRRTVELSGEKYRVLYECGQDTTWRATVFEATLGADAPDVKAPMIARWFSLDEILELKLDEFAKAAATDLGML